MKLRAAPYPYSKMCELCELCELFVKKIPPLCGGIFLFLLSRIYSKATEWRAFFCMLNSAYNFWPKTEYSSPSRRMIT